MRARELRLHYPVVYSAAMKRLWILALGLLAISGCGGGTDTSGPGDLVYGIDSFGQLVSFRSGAPENLFQQTAILGMESGETIQSLDFRPETSQLLGLSNANSLYAIDAATGVAELVRTPVVPVAENVFAAIECDPATDTVRLITSAGANYRIDPDTGSIIGREDDLTLAGDAQAKPLLADLAYLGLAGIPGPTLLGVDRTGRRLVLVGGENGNPSPDGGVVTNIQTANALPAVADGGRHLFDVEPSGGTAYLIAGTSGRDVYQVNLVNGALTPLGTVAGQGTLRAMSVLPN